jgi:small ligand-binding sensory domain FIST
MVTIAAAASVERETRAALEAALEETLPGLENRDPHLALVFVSPHHRADYRLVGSLLGERLPGAVVLGCSGDGIIGGGHELEHRPALSLWMAHLPGVELLGYRLSFETSTNEIGETTGCFSGWPEEPGSHGEEAGGTALLLADPYSFPAELFLDQAALDLPGVAIVGGMASGGLGPGDTGLFLDGEVHADGAVGVFLNGQLRIQSLVSQGCRPIGRHLVVTRAQDNIIQELGGQPALLQLKELLQEISRDERVLAQRGLHVGQVVEEAQERFGPGDFLIRNVVGLDPDSGSIAVSDMVRRGQTIQFHVRDADAASQDLEQVLRRLQPPTAGVLMFSCNGRGQALFQQQDHDIGLLEKVLGSQPAAGFFAAGEIGPVGGRSFLHGFSTSIAHFPATGS